MFIYAGLRGAVAFYLCLNFLSYEDSNLQPTLICLIMFTVLVLGGTTVFLINILNYYFPDDQIFKESDIDGLFDLEDSVRLGDDDVSFKNKEERSKSIGMITRIENFDRNFLQILLRKDGWEEDDPMFYQEYMNKDPHLDYSSERRMSDLMKRSNNIDVSPYRNSIMHKRNIPKKVTPEVIAQMSIRENMSTVSPLSIQPGFVFSAPTLASFKNLKMIS